MIDKPLNKPQEVFQGKDLSLGHNFLLIDKLGRLKTQKYPLISSTKSILGIFLFIWKSEIFSDYFTNTIQKELIYNSFTFNIHSKKNKIILFKYFGMHPANI